MLGSVELNNIINNSDSLNIQQNTILEINKNNIESPYLYGTGTAPTISSIEKIFSSVSGSPAPTSVSRGYSTDIYPSTNCQLIISGNQSASVTVTKLVANAGVVTLTTDKPHTIQAGETFYLDGFNDIPVGQQNIAIDGIFIAITGTSGNVIRYDTGNINFTVAQRDLKRKGRALYSINEYASYQNNTSSAVKFFMRLKSDYEFQKPNDDTFIEEFTVSFRVLGLDSSDKPVLTQVVTKSVSVNASGWTDVEIPFANPDSSYNKVKIELRFDSPPGQKAALLVDQFVCTTVSDYEVYVQNRMPLRAVFDSYRPGEILVDYPNQVSDIDISPTSTFPQQCTPVQMASQYALIEPYTVVQRSITPFAGNPCNYYVSGSSEDSKKIWAVYDNTFKTNKIIIKVNAIIAKPSNYNIKLLIDNAWQTIKLDSNNKSFNEHGVLELYKYNEEWSTLAWTSSPTLSETTGDITNYVEVGGIAFECLSQSYVVENSSLSKPPAINVLELIEISPRLEVDLSKYVIDISIDKLMSEDSEIPLPLGVLVSGLTLINFSNIPIILNKQDNAFPSEKNDVVPMSNLSESSPFRKLLVRGSKIRGRFILEKDGNKYSIPSFTTYVDRWIDNLGTTDLKIGAECFDSTQRLFNTKCQSLYLRNATINEIIFAILDSVGYAEYSFRELNSLATIEKSEENISKKRIPHFWTDKNLSVGEMLNQIFRVYQIAMYCDEYGIARFNSLNKINNKLEVALEEKEDFFTFQDFSNNEYKSNTIAMVFEERDPVKNIVLNYKKPRVSLSDPEKDNNKKDPNGVLIKTAPEVVWEPDKKQEVLPYFELAPPGIYSNTQNRIRFNPFSVNSILRTISDYSGYLMIDQEIIKYDGIEFQFTSQSDPDFLHIQTIKNAMDIDSTISQLITKYNLSSINYMPTGYLVNVERGLFGTSPDRHIVLAAGRKTGWLGRSFNEKFEGVQTVADSANTFTSNNGNIKVLSSTDAGGFFIYPPENNTVGRKRRFAMSYYIENVPANKSGSLGAAIGVTIENNKITNGLFIFTGLKPKKKQHEVDLVIKQVYTVSGTTKVETVSVKEKLDFSPTAIVDDKELLELYVEFNENMNEVKIFIGTDSVFKKIIKKGKNKEISRNTFATINPINKGGLFGFVAHENVSGLLDSLAFTAKSDPRNNNLIQLNDLDSDYEGSYDGKAGTGFYIGPDSLLTQLVYDQFLDGLSYVKDGFIWTGAPVARGINIYEVDYKMFPVIDDPKIIFTGYSYKREATASRFIYMT